MNRGRVVVNEKFETSIPGVYAIGDLIFGAQLAHAASAQESRLQSSLQEKEVSVDVNVVPAVYTQILKLHLSVLRKMRKKKRYCR